jgi:hypothetical protein
MKTSELTGAALDWAVAKCEEGEALAEGWHPHFAPYGGELRLRATPYTPSTDWSQGGPIIERECICIHQRMGETAWWADYANPQLKPDGTGHLFLFKQAPTPLIAAMRCYVASKLGDEVYVPEELV